MLTGNFGRPSVGIGPVRGQNNVQGACDMGALPNVYPGYQKVEDEKIREKFEKTWGVKLSEKNGYHLTEVPKLVLEEDKIKAYYIMGEDPVQSDPNSEEVREALDKMESVIVQDIFMNKTALHADVILPATSWGEHEGVYNFADRGFQRFRKAIEPKGDAENLGVNDQELVRISSRRGSVVTRALVTDRVNKGAVYMTYQWWIGACNELTLDNLDPISKTPEYKYCAVKIQPIEDQKSAEQFIKDEYAKIRRQMNVQLKLSSSI